MKINYPEITINFNNEEKFALSCVKDLINEIYENCTIYNCEEIGNEENYYNFHDLSKIYDIIKFLSENKKIILK